MTDPTKMADELERRAMAATPGEKFTYMNADALWQLGIFTRNHALAIVALLRVTEKMRKAVEPELLRIAAEACRRAATKEIDEVAIELFAMAEIQERACATYDAAKESRDG